jgi:hypothetical protein
MLPVFFLLHFMFQSIPLPDPSRPSTGDEPGHRILVLGDSHMMGEYGLHLMEELSRFGQVLSIAVGGAGSRDFSRGRIWDVCCGYDIRKKSRFDPAVRKVELGRRRFQLAYARYNGSLTAILYEYRPTAIVLHLGNNQSDEHQTLLDELRRVTFAPVFWVGVIQCDGSRSVNRRIQAAVVRNPNVFYVPNDDLTYLKIRKKCDYHFGGELARRWATENATRILGALRLAPTP